MVQHRNRRHHGAGSRQTDFPAGSVDLIADDLLQVFGAQLRTGPASVMPKIPIALGKSTQMRFDVINLSDNSCQIRSGVGAPQFDQRRTFLLPLIMLVLPGARNRGGVNSAWSYCVMLFRTASPCLRV